MKRFLLVFLSVLILTGCAYSDVRMDRAVDLRNTLLKSNGCEFTAVIVADYGNKVYTFTMACQTDKNGNLFFHVKEPQTISGISGELSSTGGKLKFTDTVLAFELLADEQLSPVAAPWIVINTLRSGYISACGADAGGLRICIDDTYRSTPLTLDIWTDENNLPVRGEILYDGLRILSVDIREFRFL